jgi:uncharacterized protein
VHKVKLSIVAARHLALHAQGLDGQWALPSGKEGVAQAIERLGYVQIDTIAVVQRAHHHTLWTRCADYAPPMLDELQAQDRRVFEYWAHAAAFIPFRDYRYYLPRMRAYADSPRTREWLAQNESVVHDVLARISDEGALGSADFEAPEGFKRGTWWNWKPAKRALEVLFSTGQLMVSARRGFQRVYDLAERVLPAETNTREPEPAELGRFVVRRALETQGLATANELHWGHRRQPYVAAALQELLAAGDILPIEIEGLPETYYALTSAVAAGGPARGGPRLHILSPFDNLIIQRRRLGVLFGFEYTIECYTPAAKRKYGYFCLPVLWGEHFVGRLDAKAERKQGTLLVHKLTLEPGAAGDGAMLAALADKLRTFAAFNGCQRVIMEHPVPGMGESTF